MNFFDAIWAILTFLGSPFFVVLYGFAAAVIHVIGTTWWVDGSNNGGAWATFGNHWAYYYRHWAWAWLVVFMLFVYLPTIIVAVEHGADLSW